MGNANPVTITVETIVQVPVERAWELWTQPEHITKWNAASEDWHTPTSENDLRPGGRFVSRMEAKDGSFGFDFGGIYDEVVLHKQISYTLDDGRKVNILFSAEGEGTKVVESFDAEGTNPIELQQAGWQAIMNNFKAYTEANR